MGNNSQNIFQIGLLVIFGVMAVVGVISIAMNKNMSDDAAFTVPVVIWGPPLEDRAMTMVINDLKKDNESFENVSYVEKNPNTIYGDLLEAIATGNSPDLVLMNSSGLLPLRNKLYPISFETIPLQNFYDTYVEGGDVFVLSDGIYALPLFVDPLVLYWNRDIFTKTAIAQVPQDWDTFVQLVPRLSTIVGGSELIQSGIAFGEYDNVLHAKEILSALIMQTGVSIVIEHNNKFITDIFSVDERVEKPDLALRFYTSFSNPVKTVYSWNKTFERSREAFAANKVAMYAGFVSEESILTEINPNLNFGMAPLPQSKNTHKSLTYGKFYGIAVLKASKNPQVALMVARILSDAGVSKLLANNAGLPSARRDVLTEVNSTDPFGHTKTQSAIMSRAWLEPAPQSAVNDIFSRAVNGIVSGTLTPGNAVSQSATDLTVLLTPYNNRP
ncbi:MAG: hypothetical protein UV60_C0006G0079 [Parcubacteria group bacterium GW2011_GWA2_43_11]|nr:MAG: hypothetical protein UV60_C0006G0079 [Parcubacteria group bacterium GW2011_GWA2_43_11]